MRTPARPATLFAALTLTTALAVPLTACAVESSGGEGNLSIDVALPLTLLEAAGRDSDLRMTCDTDADPETAAMMASLRSQGRRGVYRGRDEDGRYEARRRGDVFELRVWDEDDHQKLLLTVPWRLADCLLGGAGAGEREVAVRELYGGKLEVRFESAESRVRFTLD